jgi:hypothetical protein
MNKLARQKKILFENPITESAITKMGHCHFGGAAGM